MKTLLRFLLLSCTAWGQLQFNTFDGTHEEPIKNGVYDLPGPFVVAVNAAIRIRVRNLTGQAACILRVPSSMGTGFSLAVGNQSVPRPLAAGDAIDIGIDFTPPIVARSASANLEIQYVALSTYPSCSGLSAPSNFVKANVIIQAMGIVQSAIVSLTETPVLASFIQFPDTKIGETSTVRVYLANPGSTALTVPSDSLSVTPHGLFTIQNPPSFPLTIGPRGNWPLDLQFAPTTLDASSGSLSVGPLKVNLTGKVVPKPFSKLSIRVDPFVQSAVESPSLRIELAEPAPREGLGSITIEFKPASPSDFVENSSLTFANPNTKQLSFQFSPGATVATFNTKPYAYFQTGTLAGTITFTANFDSVKTSLDVMINPAKVQIDQTTASRPNEFALRIKLDGFDNSKSITKLTFTFYVKAGNDLAMVPNPIVYDAAKLFTDFFQKSKDGGMFSLLATFPVKGSASNIHSVDVECLNSQGTTMLKQLLFAPCKAPVTTPCFEVGGCTCQ